MPMHPRPMADTVKPLLPSCRSFMLRLHTPTIHNTRFSVFLRLSGAPRRWSRIASTAMTTTPSHSRPTYDDVNLILRLYEMRREDRLRDARRWFTASFKVKTHEEFTALCPGGSETNASYRMV